MSTKKKSNSKKPGPELPKEDARTPEAIVAEHRKEVLAKSQEIHSNMTIIAQLIAQGTDVPAHYVQKFPEMAHNALIVTHELMTLYSAFDTAAQPQPEPEEEDVVEGDVE